MQGRRFLPVAGAILALAACGYKTPTSNNTGNVPDPPTGTPAPTANVEVRNGYFNPANPLIAVGGTVTWTWIDSGHSVTSFGSPSFSPNAPISNKPHTLGPVVFPTAGTYTFYCSAHATPRVYGSGTETGAGLRPLDKRQRRPDPRDASWTTAAAGLAPLLGLLCRLLPGRRLLLHSLPGRFPGGLPSHLPGRFPGGLLLGRLFLGGLLLRCGLLGRLFRRRLWPPPSRPALAPAAPSGFGDRLRAGLATGFGAGLGAAGAGAGFLTGGGGGGGGGAAGGGAGVDEGMGSIHPDPDQPISDSWNAAMLASSGCSVTAGPAAKGEAPRRLR